MMQYHIKKSPAQKNDLSTSTWLEALATIILHSQYKSLRMLKICRKGTYCTQIFSSREGGYHRWRLFQIFHKTCLICTTAGMCQEHIQACQAVRAQHNLLHRVLRYAGEQGSITLPVICLLQYIHFFSLETPFAFRTLTMSSPLQEGVRLLRRLCPLSRPAFILAALTNIGDVSVPWFPIEK